MFRTLLITALVLVLASPVLAQQKTPAAPASPHNDVAFLFDFERAQIDATGSSSFWLKGGSVDASFPLWRYLAVAGDVTGEHAGNVQNGVNVNKLAFLAGPRLRGYAGGKQSMTFFGQALFGVVHGFNGLYPSTGSPQYSASSWGMQAGGGLDVRLSHHLGVRLIEADWVYSTLPNNASNTQNDFKLGFGISLH